MAFKSKPSPERMPFSAEVGERWGTGQDNTVYRLVHPAEKPHLRKPAGLVLKINKEMQVDGVN